MLSVMIGSRNDMVRVEKINIRIGDINGVVRYDRK